jgi:hypothetical protein
MEAELTKAKNLTCYQHLFGNVKYVLDVVEFGAVPSSPIFWTNHGIPPLVLSSAQL